MKASRWLLIVSLWVGILCSTSAPAFWFFGGPKVVELEPVVWNAQAMARLGNGLRVSTYNLENFNDGIHDGPDFSPSQAAQHMKDAIRMVDRINSDIAVFQEIESANILKQMNQALKRPFASAYVTSFKNRDGQVDPLNLAILSRIPFESVHAINFSSIGGKDSPPRGAICAIYKLGENRKLLLYGVHLKSNFGKKERNRSLREQALKIVRDDADRIMRKQRDVEWEVLVVGDTNVDPELDEFKDDPSFSALTGWVDWWYGKPIQQRVTCPTRYGDPALVFPPACFDRAFSSPSLKDSPWKVIKIQSIQDGVATKNSTYKPGQGGHISDHYPVIVDLYR